MEECYEVQCWLPRCWSLRNYTGDDSHGLVELGDDKIGVSAIRKTELLCNWVSQFPSYGSKCRGRRAPGCATEILKSMIPGSEFSCCFFQMFFIDRVLWSILLARWKEQISVFIGFG